MSRYRKKPVVIEAVIVKRINQQFPEVAPFDELPAWLKVEISNRKVFWTTTNAGDVISVRTSSGTVTAQPGDYLIRGVAGEIYPCKPEVFQATYERHGE